MRNNLKLAMLAGANLALTSFAMPANSGEATVNQETKTAQVNAVSVAAIYRY